MQTQLTLYLSTHLFTAMSNAKYLLYAKKLIHHKYLLYSTLTINITVND